MATRAQLKTAKQAMIDSELAWRMALRQADYGMNTQEQGQQAFDRAQQLLAEAAEARRTYQALRGRKPKHSANR